MALAVAPEHRARAGGLAAVAAKPGAREDRQAVRAATVVLPEKPAVRAVSVTKASVSAEAS